MPRTPHPSHDVWPVVHEERRRLVDDLAALPADRWSTPSLCAEWDVHDVLAHLVYTAVTTRRRFLTDFARCRFDFDRFTARGVEITRRPDPAQTLDALRAVRLRTDTPPAPLDSRLVEAFVHGEDIRRPLGIPGHYPAPALARAITLQARTSEQFGGGRNLVAGLSLAATDADLSLGDGPAVTGPAVALLLAVCGRDAALDELSGPGLDTLRPRVRPGH